jgi:mRNA interferase MazF
MKLGRTCSRHSRPSTFSLLRLVAGQAKARGSAADAGRGDWILCQITSNPYGDSQAIELDGGSFATGSLRLTSYARPGKLFTANRNLIVAQVGMLEGGPFKRIIEAVIGILQGGNAP